MAGNFQYVKTKNGGYVTDANPLPTTQQLKVETVIDDENYDLAAASYSVDASSSYDYIIDNVSFDFSSTESRTITITSDNGSEIYKSTNNTSLSVVVSNINFGQSAEQTFNVSITQTSGACTVDVTANIRNNPVALTADPVIAAGQNFIGYVGNEGHICEDNSTDVALSASEVFEGVWQDTLNYNVIIIGIKADQDSASDGLEVLWSSDGITEHDDDVFTISANRGKVFTFSPARRYLKLRYTNGAVAQTSFNLQTIFKTTGFKASSHRIQDSIVAEDDAELVKAVLTGKNPSDTFVNFQATTAGNFKVSMEELESSISTNSNSQLKTTIYDEGGIPASVDDSTESLQFINYEHHEIHSGSHYNYCDYQTGNAINATIEFVMTTPNTTKWVHLVFEAYSSTGAFIELYEGTTGVTGGTTITPRNNNRNSLNTSDVTLVKDPTSITSDGTRAAGFLAGANRSGGSIVRENEYVLKQNTSYLIRITSRAASNDISWAAEWYEHTDKN